jgi:hypothetical protein
LGLSELAGISSKFYKCGRSEGKGNEAWKVQRLLKFFIMGAEIKVSL